MDEETAGGRRPEAGGWGRSFQCSVSSLQLERLRDEEAKRLRDQETKRLKDSRVCETGCQATN